METHELNNEPNIKFLSQFNGNKDIDMVLSDVCILNSETR